MSLTSTQDSQVRKGAIRWLVRETLGNLMLIAILFGIVGRWDWWNGWALSGIYILWSALCALFILPVNPAMLAERARPHRDTKKWDTALLGALGAAMVGQYLVASLDVRFGWSPPLPPIFQIVGLIVAIFSNDILLVWAMASNAFFVSTVRIQSERQHSVCSSGPYRFLRHPGYLASILLGLGAPLLLNSLWALLPGLGIVFVMVVRTILEDRTLHQELPGYTEYARRVPYRLFPGVW